MLVVGLTGGVATGKSTVAQMFAQKGARVIDADKIVGQLLRPTGACFKSVVKTFGSSVVKKGKLDKRALADIVFKDKRKLKKLEAIIHPKVRQVINKELQKLKKGKKTKVVILDIPLLFESKWKYRVDTTIVVKATQLKQIQRAVERMKISKAQALRRIKAQMPLRNKLRLADFIIDSNKNLNQTKKQVREIWEKLLLKEKKRS